MGIENKKEEIDYIGIMDSVEVKQMILQGPPGTSKTYGAKKIIESVLLKNQERKKLEDYLIKDYEFEEPEEPEEPGKPKWKNKFGWDMVQFHPSYCYEDFVRGITVSTKKENIVYETVNKIFGNICALAEHYEGDEDSKFFLIIDEINRADVATVFGELIYALENRGEEISIPYAINGTYKLKVPKNLYIIGTMNTADKSIGTIDYAIRRRFLFFDCLPNEKVIEDYLNENEKLKKYAVNMLKILKKLVDEIHEKNYHAKDLYIGHTYFLVKEEKKLEMRLRYQILPILREYVENGNLIIDKWNEFEKKFEINDINDNKMRLEQFKSYLQGESLLEQSFEPIYELLKTNSLKEETND